MFATINMFITLLFVLENYPVQTLLFVLLKYSQSVGGPLGIGFHRVIDAVSAECVPIVIVPIPFSIFFLSLSLISNVVSQS